MDLERAALLTEMSFDDAFKHVVDKLAEASETHFILVPSVRDAHHIYPFPQPPFPISPANVQTSLPSLVRLLIVEHSSALEPRDAFSERTYDRRELRRRH